MMRQAMAAQEVLRWRRGSARRDGEWIVVDVADRYDLGRAQLQAAAFALAGIRDIEDALRFANEYGLLRSARIGQEQRELFPEWQHEARSLTEVATLYIHLHRAESGDADSVAYLRSYYERSLTQHSFFPELPDRSHTGLFHVIAGHIAFTLNAGRFRVKTNVRSIMNLDHVDTAMPVHANWEFVLTAGSLSAAIHHTLADLIVAGREMRFCEDCGRVFLVRDRRQRFCNETCAARTRYYRKAQRKRGIVAAIDAAVESV